MNGIRTICIALTMLAAPPVVLAQTPTAPDDRLVVELVAQEPDIVTPTGIAVDERGRVWVIENNTHQRQQDYKGPTSDRIRIFDDYDAAGRARKISTFAEGFRNSMGLAFGPKGDVFFATRSEIMVLRDTDGDDVVDEKATIVRLDTPGDYPHNGLSGFAFDAFDNVYFGMGENLGAPYKLIGSDGTALSGGGEGGNIFRCRPDGSKLLRVATGFWNPFHLTFDAFGRLFAVDNDPDSRPPCRLLHIIQGGDYGYRFRNGRKGLHPFTAWNGELPGTLPMVAGTAEAPSGIVAYESNGLPDEYVGDLIVTSWGDHVIQRFKLEPRGASFTSQAQTLVQGGEEFRPVGIATAPDGSLIVSDWVDKSYPVHGKGRIWRIRMKQPPETKRIRTDKFASLDVKRMAEFVGHPRREIRAKAADALAIRSLTETTVAKLEYDPNPRARMQLTWSMTKITGETALQKLRGDSCPDIRAEAAHMIGEFHSTPPQPLTEVMLRVAALKDESPLVRMMALQQLTADESMRSLLPMLADPDPFIVGSSIDVLGRPGRAKLLLTYAQASDPRIRVGVLLALRRTSDAEGRRLLSQFLDDPEPAVRRAAIQWVGEQRLEEFAPLLTKAASKPPVTRELFEAFLAAQEFLAGVVRKPTDEVAGEEYVAKILADESQPAALRALALRTLRPDHKAVEVPQLQRFISSDDEGLRHEAVRTLSLRSDAESQEALRHVAADPNSREGMRVWAIVGLGLSAGSSPETRRLLGELLQNGPSELQHEALRSLRGTMDAPTIKQTVLGWLKKNLSSGSVAAEDAQNLNEEVLLALRVNQTDPIDDSLKPILKGTKPRPESEEDWRAVLEKPGDSSAGERVFFHPRGPQCFACHRVNGRGGVAGSDLSPIGRALDPEKLIRSIVTPSKDIAPQFTTWAIALGSGQVLTGVIVNEDPAGTITLGDAQGKTVQVNVADIAERKAQNKSIMPENLAELMTVREFRDLIAFLRELK